MVGEDNTDAPERSIFMSYLHEDPQHFSPPEEPGIWKHSYSGDYGTSNWFKMFRTRFKGFDLADSSSAPYTPEGSSITHCPLPHTETRVQHITSVSSETTILSYSSKLFTVLGNETTRLGLLFARRTLFGVLSPAI